MRNSVFVITACGSMFGNLRSLSIASRMLISLPISGQLQSTGCEKLQTKQGSFLGFGGLRPAFDPTPLARGGPPTATAVAVPMMVCPNPARPGEAEEPEGVELGPPTLS